MNFRTRGKNNNILKIYKHSGFRVIILTLLLLFILDLSMSPILESLDKNSENASYFNNDFRFGEKVDNTVLEAFIFHISRQEGYNIAFIGDSVVAGALVASNKDTIPAYLQDKIDGNIGRGVNVYNVGMPGNRPSDIYFSMKKLYLSHNIDLFIMNINYAFLSDKMIKENAIARPELYKDAMDNEDMAKLKSSSTAAENFIVRNVVDKWKLYKYRDELSFLIFGGNPREIVTNLPFAQKRELNTKLLLSPANPANNLDKPWYTNKPYPTDKLDHWKSVFAPRAMDEKNIEVYYLNKIREYAKKNSIKLISFLTPMNRGIIDEYGLMGSRTGIDEDLEILVSDYRRDGFTIFDFTDLVENDDFADLFHMLREGNRRVSDQLFGEISNLVVK